MEIQAQKRETLGKKSNIYRKQRQTPAVVYGNKIESTPLVVDTLDFIRVYKKAGETTLIDLKFNDGSEKVLVKEVQIHPVTMNPLHVSFHKVDLTEKIRANVPVEVTGEEECEVIKSGEGMLLVLLNEIEVEALPTDLVHSFQINVSHLNEIGDGIAISELEYNREKVEIVNKEEDEFIVKIDHAEMEEEPEEEELSEEELVAGVEATEEKEEGEEEPEDKKPSEEQPQEEAKEE